MLQLRPSPYAFQTQQTRDVDQMLILPGEPGQFHLWPGIGQGS